MFKTKVYYAAHTLRTASFNDCKDIDEASDIIERRIKGAAAYMGARFTQEHQHHWAAEITVISYAPEEISEANREHAPLGYSKIIVCAVTDKQLATYEMSIHLQFGDLNVFEVDAQEGQWFADKKEKELLVKLSTDGLKDEYVQFLKANGIFEAPEVKKLVAAGLISA